MEQGGKVRVKVTRCPEGVELEVLEWKCRDWETELDQCRVFPDSEILFKLCLGE